FAVSLDCRCYCIQHVLVAKWLGQEVDRSPFHGPNRHRDIAVPRHENDRDVGICLYQLGLKFQSTLSRQSDVEDQTAGNVWKRALEEFLSGAERPRFKTYGSEQERES